MGNMLAVADLYTVENVQGCMKGNFHPAALSYHLSCVKRQLRLTQKMHDVGSLSVGLNSTDCSGPLLLLNTSPDATVNFTLRMSNSK